MSDKCEHHDYTMVEDYIRGLQWSAEATDHEKSLVAGNIRGFYSHIRESLSTRPAESVAQGGALPPIERDEEKNRDYIPLPGGWEIQTKGNGSTFRLQGPKDGDHMPVTDPYVPEMLVRMAHDIRAACPTPATGSGGEDLPEPWALYIGKRQDADGKWQPIVEVFGEPYGVKMRLFTAAQMDAYRAAHPAQAGGGAE